MTFNTLLAKRVVAELMSLRFFPNDNNDSFHHLMKVMILFPSYEVPLGVTL